MTKHERKLLLMVAQTLAQLILWRNLGSYRAHPIFREIAAVEEEAEHEKYRQGHA